MMSEESHVSPFVKNALRFVLLPAMLPLLFTVVASMPVGVLGCRNRGLLAVSTALTSVILGLTMSIIGVRRKVQGKADHRWFALSTLILAVPAVYILLILR
jgi:ABC-type dipeptide/oligopeptide/nickel transport system permease component